VVAALVPTTDFQVQLISAVVDSGTLHDCQQAGLGIEHFSQWPDCWKFIEQHHRQFGRVPTRQTVENRFPRMSFPRGQVGDLHFLIAEVRSQWLYDRMSDLLESTVQLMTSPDHTVQDALHHLQSQAQSVQLQHGSDQKDVSLLGSIGREQVLDQAVRRIAAHHNPDLSGLRTGFSEFDKTTGGLDDTELVVLLARVTQGKSWGLLYMAANMLMQGKRVLYFPCEMSQAQVAFRLHVILQYHFLQKFPDEMKGLKPFLNQSLTQGSGYDLKSYKEFLELLEQKLPGSFIVSEPPGILRPSHVLNKIHLHKPEAVVIDYLTLMEPDNYQSGTEDWKAVKRLTSDLKRMAMHQKVPIITAAQSSRQGSSRKGPPELEDIAFGDAIGQDADRVLSIKQLSRRVTMWLTIKNRHVDSRVKGFLEHQWNQGKIKEVSQDRAMELLEEDGARGDLIADKGSVIRDV
jgi:DnaB helicase-like protein